MPEINSVSDTTHNGRDGFIIEWEFAGFTKSAARFRAIMMTAMRFPTTITTSEVVGVREFERQDYNVQVFVPTDEFFSAGIKNPIKWLREEFGGRFQG